MNVVVYRTAKKLAKGAGAAVAELRDAEDVIRRVKAALVYLADQTSV
jgi:hypothetical protein